MVILPPLYNGMRVLGLIRSGFGKSMGVNQGGIVNDAGSDGEQFAHRDINVNVMLGWQNTLLAWRMRRIWLAVYLSAIVLHAISAFVPAIGQIPLALGITVEMGLEALSYSMAAAVLLRIFLPLYWRACRTPPAVWWQWAIPLGITLTIAGVAALLSEQLLQNLQATSNDVLLNALFVFGLSAGVVGIVLFAVGNGGLVREIHRQQRALAQSRTDQTQAPMPQG